MRDAARDIRADGALPLELARGGRAAHYHAFAAMPLVILAELGAARGEDWYGLGDGALHRLVALTVAGFAEPAIFERLAGTPQQPTANSMGTGWLPLYRRRFPDRPRAPLPDMRTSHRWTGGDVMLLARVLEAGAGRPIR
jgi:poly(beta-D-mannuronate) lyase